MKLARLTCILVLFALPAHAHGSLPGGGGFYSGALHPFVALEHFLALLAGGLCLGREDRRTPLWALAAGLAIGLWWGMPIEGLAIVVLAVTLALGVALALQIQLPDGLDIAVFLAIGLAVGFETDLPPLSFKMAAVGTGVAVFLITMNAFALASVLAGSRVAVTLRIAGAWVAAAALMVLAFELRGLA